MSPKDSCLSGLVSPPVLLGEGEKPLRGGFWKVRSLGHALEGELGLRLSCFLASVTQIIFLCCVSPTLTHHATNSPKQQETLRDESSGVVNRSKPFLFASCLCVCGMCL